MDLRAELERLHTASFGWALACCDQQRREAEDVLQTVYLKILDGRARFDGRSSYRTWLFSVIRRTAIDSRRQHWLRTALLAREHREALDDPVAPSIDRTVSDSERNGNLRRVVEQLPRRQQEVLHLVFYQDLTIEEAARTLEISLGSARTHFERGKARLRTVLSDRETP